MDTSGRDLLRHPLSLAGAALATVCASVMVVFFVASMAGHEGNPYQGLMTYVVVPSLMVVGLLLIPAGAWLERRRLVRLAASGGVEPPLPIVDLNSPRTRMVGLAFLALTTVNLLLLAVATYKGLEVMDSPEFCGSCHSVMDPEASAHARSPHARVGCVACHIGPGAGWFVKSKISGSWQLVSVMFHLYPRPIPTPVHNLRPARETCEQCHWPAKFVGDRLKVFTQHADDAASTPLKTVLLVHVGGTQGVSARGIHWHVDQGVKLRYQADESREKISTVELTAGDRPTRRWQAPGAPAASQPWREMDCIDCHNRPTHVYRTPEDEVDAALVNGRLDRRLPFLRREAVQALRADYPSEPAAVAGLRQALRGFYAGSPAPAGADTAALVDDAAAELAAIWGRNVWPQMKIAWGTYPTFLGHQQAPGCFRCHDGDHVTGEGKAISGDCDLCHSILAQGEKDPAILKQLAP